MILVSWNGKKTSMSAGWQREGVGGDSLVYGGDSVMSFLGFCESRLPSIPIYIGVLGQLEAKSYTGRICVVISVHVLWGGYVC